VNATIDAALASFHLIRARSPRIVEGIGRDDNSLTGLYALAITDALGAEQSGGLRDGSCYEGIPRALTRSFRQGTVKNDNFRRITVAGAAMIGF